MFGLVVTIVVGTTISRIKSSYGLSIAFLALGLFIAFGLTAILLALKSNEE